MFIGCMLLVFYVTLFGFFMFLFKQKTAYEMRISDWSSDVCSSDLVEDFLGDAVAEVFVLGVATHVDEGQYGNGAAVAGLARRSWGRGGRGGRVGWARRQIGRAHV